MAVSLNQVRLKDRLAEINLDLPKGEHLLVTGPSGAGKTSLLALIAGVLTPDSGSVGIFTQRNGEAAVGYLMQHPERQLFAETLYDEIAFGLRNRGCPEEEIRPAVRDLVLLLGLSPSLLDRSPFSLSSGEQRRAALAGVLILDPDLLLLDEPLAGLDRSGREALIDAVGRCRRNGCTVVAASHRLDLLAPAFDRLLVLEKGAVAMGGAIRRVLAGEQRRLSALGCRLPVAARLAAAVSERSAGVISWSPFPLTDDEFLAQLPAVLERSRKRVSSVDPKASH